MFRWHIGDTSYYQDADNQNRHFMTIVDYPERRAQVGLVQERHVLGPDSPLGQLLLRARPGHTYRFEDGRGHHLDFRLTQVTHHGQELDLRNVAPEPGIVMNEPVAQDDPNQHYQSHCWNCGFGIDSAENERCPKCGRFTCWHCGVCMCQYGD